MEKQTYIPADQSGDSNTANIEALLRVPLAIAETGIRKVRTFLIINIINMIWIGYFYNAHTDASLLWMTPVFFVLTLIIVHLWFLYFALREVLRLPAKMKNFGADTWIKTNNFFQQHDDIFTRMQGSNTQLTDTMKVFGSFGESREMSREVQEMMSSIIRAMFLGNPIFLGLSLGVSSLMLLAGFILLMIHIA